jgi:hypothetical protein
MALLSSSSRASPGGLERVSWIWFQMTDAIDALYPTSSRVGFRRAQPRDLFRRSRRRTSFQRKRQYSRSCSRRYRATRSSLPGDSGARRRISRQGVCPLTNAVVLEKQSPGSEPHVKVWPWPSSYKPRAACPRKERGAVAPARGGPHGETRGAAICWRPIVFASSCAEHELQHPQSTLGSMHV